MCDSNNINILRGEKEKDSKIEFETSFIPPPNYKFCNKKPEGENDKNSFSKTTSSSPKSVAEAKEREKKNWYFVSSHIGC